MEIKDLVQKYCNYMLENHYSDKTALVVYSTCKA